MESKDYPGDLTQGFPFSAAVASSLPRSWLDDSVAAASNESKWRAVVDDLDAAVNATVSASVLDVLTSQLEWSPATYELMFMLAILQLCVRVVSAVAVWRWTLLSLLVVV